MFSRSQTTFSLHVIDSRKRVRACVISKQREIKQKPCSSSSSSSSSFGNGVCLRAYAKAHANSIAGWQDYDFVAKKGERFRDFKDEANDDARVERELVFDREYEDFFFNDANEDHESKSNNRNRRISTKRTSAGRVRFSIAKEWFDWTFRASKISIPITMVSACVAAASINAARFTFLAKVYGVASALTTGGVLVSAFAIFASVVSGFFVCAQAFTNAAVSSSGYYTRQQQQQQQRRNATNRKREQQQYEQKSAPVMNNIDEMNMTYQTQREYEYEQQQQHQVRTRPVLERYDPPVVHPTRPPTSASRHAARESYDSWVPEIPVVDPRAQVPRPSDDYYSQQQQQQRFVAEERDPKQPEWDKNESWGSYKSPGQRRREMGYEFKGSAALKNFVDPRDQYERRVSSASPEADAVYAKQQRQRTQDVAAFTTKAELRAPRHNEFDYEPVDESERLLPRARARPKPGYIPTEVLIAMGGASLSNHIKTKFEDGSIREMRAERERSKQRPRASTASSDSPSIASTATNMFGEKVNLNDVLFRDSR
jgi:hypothetical protein